MKKAQSLIEYALILALVTLVAITALSLLGRQVNNAVQNTGSSIGSGMDSASSAYCQSLGMEYSGGVCTSSSASTPPAATPTP